MAGFGGGIATGAYGGWGGQRPGNTGPAQPPKPGTFTTEQTAGQFVPGVKNDIVWGGALTPGSTGGNIAFNPATGQVEYVKGYTQSGSPASSQAPVDGLKAAAPLGGGATGGGGSSAPPSSGVTTGSPSRYPDPVQSGQSEPQSHDVPPGGGLVPPMAPGGGGSQGLVRGEMPMAPTEGPGGGALGGGAGLAYIDSPMALRQGIGQRNPPNLQAALAGLGRTVY